MTEYNESHNNEMGNMDNQLVKEEGFEGIVWHSKKGMYNLFLDEDIQNIRRSLAKKRKLLNDDDSYDTLGKDWHIDEKFADVQDSLDDISKVERMLDDIEADPTTLIPHLEAILSGSVDYVDLFVPKYLALGASRQWTTPVLTLVESIYKSFSLVFLPKTFRKVGDEFIDVEILNLQERKDETIRLIKSASNWITAGGYDLIRAVEEAKDNDTLNIIDRSQDWYALHFPDDKK